MLRPGWKVICLWAVGCQVWGFGDLEDMRLGLAGGFPFPF